ncbi:MAG: sugar phosphate isomerase/epimerase [Bacteroidales bacterium]|nr:sugar phosphate isomerase/epimerase [Bacteroidales bacterium]
MKRKYSAILGNLGNTCDRFCSSYKTNLPTIEMLKAAAKIPNVTGIELVGTWDIAPETTSEMKKALTDLNLSCVSIIPDLFSDNIYWKGSYSSKDPNIRQHAIDYTYKMCDISREMGCQIVNIWPGQDGYDYLLTADYQSERKWLCDAISEIASEYSDLKFALEYKPKEPRTHSYLARIADTLLLAQETTCENVGVCIDTGHAFNAGEVVAESIVLAKRAGNKLFHMHFNDNYTAWDDDMIVGSVHTVCYLEILYWLDRCGYDGWLSMDQYPYREDAAGAIGESIEWLLKFDNIISTNRLKMDKLIGIGDGVATSKFLRNVIL